jgi:hypothetical protein
MAPLSRLIQTLCDSEVDFVVVGDFARVRANSIEIDLFGRRCWVISLDDLIRAKEALGREKDLLAVKVLKALREKQGKS